MIALLRGLMTIAVLRVARLRCALLYCYRVMAFGAGVLATSRMIVLDEDCLRGRVKIIIEAV